VVPCVGDSFTKVRGDRVSGYGPRTARTVFSDGGTEDGGEKDQGRGGGGQGIEGGKVTQRGERVNLKHQGAALEIRES